MPTMNNSRAAVLSGHDLALRAERIDTDNWFDEFAGAPAHVAAALGLVARREGELAMVRSHVAFIHFNMVLTLGCPAVADQGAFDAIERFFAQGGNGDGNKVGTTNGAKRHWVIVNDHSRPHDLAQRLLARGYEPAGAWERVVLQGVPIDRGGDGTKPLPGR
jgi:hypothetical protein